MQGFIALIGILSCLTILKVEAAQNYTYVLDQFPAYASMTVNVQDPAPLTFGTRIATVKMSASYFGMAVGNLEELSVISDHGQPVLDSRCRSPKDTSRNYNCYSSRFDGDDLWFKGYNGTKPILVENMTAGDPGVRQFRFSDIYRTLENEYFVTPEFHNATSIFLILFRPDFGLAYNDRVYYVTGNEEFYRIRIKVKQLNANTLDVKFEPIGNAGQAAATFPGRMAYDTNTKRVIRIYITVKNKEYVLRAR